MKIREKIFSNYVLRNLFRGSLITNYTNKRGDFTPFFEYKVGAYKDNYCLYFRNEPIAAAYYNEIFNKMACYYANDAIQFILFHLERYPDKNGFLNFLFHELEHRHSQLSSLLLLPSITTTNSFKRDGLRRISIYKMALAWVTRQLEEMQVENKKTIYTTFLRNDLKIIVNNHLAEHGITNSSKTDIAEFSNALLKEVDAVVGKIEEQTSDLLSKMSESYLTGRIKGDNKAISLFITVLIALKDYQYKRNGKSSEKLFDSFSEADIASMLKLHFDYFKTGDHKPDTIRKNYVAPVKNDYYENSKKVESMEQIIKSLLD